jgi:hypothetical protein
MTIMATRNFNDPRTRLKALCYDSRLKILGPSPVSTAGLDNLEATNKHGGNRGSGSPDRSRSAESRDVARGFKRAAVAMKLSVIMHTLLKTGELFERAATAA